MGVTDRESPVSKCNVASVELWRNTLSSSSEVEPERVPSCRAKGGVLAVSAVASIVEIANKREVGASQQRIEKPPESLPIISVCQHQHRGSANIYASA